MTQWTSQKLFASCIVLLSFSSLSGCAKRATDCNWNEDCESSAGASSIGGATTSEGGVGGQGGGGGTPSVSGGNGGTSVTTIESTTPPCSGLPDSACSITQDYGVFVAAPPFGDDQNGAGTQKKPYATLAKALSVAAVPKNDINRNVFVCSSAGSFTLTETLNINVNNVDGVSIYGGFDCSDKTTWTYEVSPNRRSTFVSEVPLAVKLEGLEKKVRIENLSIKAADATVPGDSSIAMLVVNSPKVALSNVELIAGNGAAGSNALPAQGKGSDGVNGNPGTAACVPIGADAFFVLGAAQAVTKCNNVEVSWGAKGGVGAINNDQILNPIETFTVGGPGENGTPAPTPNPELFGYGGLGAQGTSVGCTVGKDGANGIPGSTVETVVGPGSLSSLGYVTTNGNRGKDGTPGQGGGGGGGALAATLCGYIAAPLPGASGGSGGGGGCGGLGGLGGQGGGASLALALLDSPVSLVGCTLTANNGGKGGNGGSGQVGGQGGIYGQGGSGASSSGSDACKGGSGGKGGTGSPGGGGAGGDSASIGYVGEAPHVDADTILAVTPTVGASGGLDGNGLSTSVGAQGKLGQTLKLKS